MATENNDNGSQPIICHGPLLKFTNVVKGYQYRWFIVNNKLATFDYYEKEGHKRSIKPRGCLSLIFASVSPLVEDSLTFIVNAKTGNYFKLKAQSTKERQKWINSLRSAIVYFNTNIQNGRFYIDPNGGLFKFRNDKDHRSYHSTTSLNGSTMSESNLVIGSGASIFNDVNHVNISAYRDPTRCSVLQSKPFNNANNLTAQMDAIFSEIVRNINNLPAFVGGSKLTTYDKNLLVTKATCAATINCLKDCVNLLRHHRLHHSILTNRNYDSNNPNILSKTNRLSSQAEHNPTGSVNSLPAVIGSEEKKLNDEDIDDRTIVSARSINELNRALVLDITPNKFPSTDNLTCKFLLPIEGLEIEPSNPIDLTEAVDDSNNRTKLLCDDEVNHYDENKNVLQHLIAQVKLGMDLTKVTLPTFILEKRSLLEMFSDYMGHPDLFLKISSERTAEHRMKALFLWYVTAFHAGRKSSVAKKPYNPIIGETFHCMWHVPSSDFATENVPCHHIYFTAEQVSHHPPITAFCVQCPSKNMCLNASIHTKSKFQGMSIVAQMEGRVILYLGDYDEEYQFTLPNAHARNILSVPKLELGDKVTITCSKTKYSSSLVFHNKALFGHSAVNKISGEIKDPDNKVLIKLAGDWNTILDIEDVATNKISSVNVSDLSLYDKYVNPEIHQKMFESRKLWRLVTESLHNNDMERATKCKKELENRQRQSENVRNSKKLQFPVKYFQSTLDGRWVFKSDVQYKARKCF